MDRLALIFDDEAFDPRQNMPHFIGAAFRQQSHKFIAAEPHGEIGTTNRALQAVGEAFDYKVAGSVAMAIIDRFQFVQIKKQNRERPAVALSAANFLGEALFTGAAIVESGELIERSKLIDFRSQTFHFRERLNLFSELTSHSVDQHLLVDHIDAEEEHHSNERSDRLVQIERVGSGVMIEHGRKSKGSYGQGEQQDHRHGGGPQPPLATVQMAQMGVNFLRTRRGSPRTSFQVSCQSFSRADRLKQEIQGFDNKLHPYVPQAYHFRYLSFCG